jgi:hypothetical protein
VTFSLLQARFALAKSTILIVVLPSIALDNSYFFNPTVKLDASIMYELFGEPVTLLDQRNGAHENIFLQIAPRSTVYVTDGVQLVGSDGEVSVLAAPIMVEHVELEPANKRKRTCPTLVVETPSCTSQVIRSTRCNSKMA